MMKMMMICRFWVLSAYLSGGRLSPLFLFTNVCICDTISTRNILYIYYAPHHEEPVVFCFDDHCCYLCSCCLFLDGVGGTGGGGGGDDVMS